MASNTRRTRLALTALLVAASAAACDVKWGGGHIALEHPRSPRAGQDSAATAAPPPVPLPKPPFVYLVRFEGDGSASAVPFARAGAAGLETLGWPAGADAGYAARFDSSFARPGATLALQVAARRVGTLIVTGTRMAVNATCPSVTDVRTLVAPGQSTPRWAFAVGPGLPDSVPARVDLPSMDDRMRTFGPILAENLLKTAGVEHAYLAQRAELQAVPLPGDTLAGAAARGLAATYLIGDTLAPVPPSSESAVSLFYLAVFDPARGYVPEWSSVHRYGSAADKRVLSWLGALRLGTRRLDMLRETDGSAAHVAAHEEGNSRDIAWTEEGLCPALRSLLEAPRAESGTTSDSAAGADPGAGGG
jgi:hypothetical protein